MDYLEACSKRETTHRSIRHPIYHAHAWNGAQSKAPACKRSQPLWNQGVRGLFMVHPSVGLSECKRDTTEDLHLGLDLDVKYTH